MIFRALVQSERPDEYMGKKGLVRQQIATLFDQSEGDTRLAQALEYALSDEEKVQYAGKLQDKVITFGLREISPFGSVLRARGKIVSVEGVGGTAARKAA